MHKYINLLPPALRQNQKALFGLVALVVGLVVIGKAVGGTTLLAQNASNDTGALNQACNTDGTCSTGLACMYTPDKTTQQFTCLPPVTPDPQYKTIGGPGEPCKSDGTCNDGYVCGDISGDFFCVVPKKVSEINQKASEVIPTVADTTTPPPAANRQPLPASSETNSSPTTTQQQPSTSVSTPTPSNGTRQLYETCIGDYQCDASQGLVCNNAYGNSGYCVKGNSQ